eukprot:6200727-Pleurochrysis_carterae.AAC.1
MEAHLVGRARTRRERALASGAHCRWWAAQTPFCAATTLSSPAGQRARTPFLRSFAPIRSVILVERRNAAGGLWRNAARRRVTLCACAPRCARGGGQSDASARP